MSELPPLPAEYDGTGHGWMDELSGGWYAVGVWGRDGWNLGKWPYTITVHYDSKNLYGLATYTEGDITVREFPTREARDRATDEIAVFYWNHYEMDSAPKDLDDPRLGPFKM